MFFSHSSLPYAKNNNKNQMSFPPFNFKNIPGLQISGWLVHTAWVTIPFIANYRRACNILAFNGEHSQMQFTTTPDPKCR